MTDAAVSRHGARQRGFTLVEAIISIMLIGILGGMVAVFMRAPIDAYFDTARRAALTDAADGALRRIARDVRTALPNSIRGPAAASNQCFEFLPVVASGRYRVLPGSSADVLDFTATDTTFDVLAHIGLPPAAPVAGNYHVAIYNLGISGADAYAGDTTSLIATASTTSLTFASKQFPFESPGRRFHVIPNFAVVYFCANGALYRNTQAISSARMAGCPAAAAGAMLVDNVTCSFVYDAVVAQRNGVLSAALVIAQQGESVRLQQEVHVNNAP